MILFMLQVVFLVLWLTAPTFAAVPLWIVFSPLIIAIAIAVFLCVAAIFFLVLAALSTPRRP